MTDEIVQAEVIDDDLMIPQSSFEIDMSGIQADVEELTLAIDDALTVYGDLLVEPEDIVKMPYAEVRRCERTVSSAVRTADELRRKLNRDYKVPLDRAKVRYDELMGPVIQLHAAYKQRRIQLDEEEAERKKDAIRAFYERRAPQLALPLAGQDKALVPFERIFATFGAKWLNKQAELVSIENEVAGIVARLVEGERALDGAGLAHTAEAKAVYWQTFDADAAIARDRELVAIAQRQAALEAERAKATAAAAAASVPASSPSPETAAAAPAAQPTPAVRKPRVMLIDGATDDECRQIGAFAKSLGISGVFKGERFYQAVKDL